MDTTTGIYSAFLQPLDCVTFSLSQTWNLEMFGVADHDWFFFLHREVSSFTLMQVQQFSWHPYSSQQPSSSFILFYLAVRRLPEGNLNGRDKKPGLNKCFVYIHIKIYQNCDDFWTRILLSNKVLAYSANVWSC